MSPHFRCRVATIGDIPAMATIRAAVWGTHEYWVSRISAYIAGESHSTQALSGRIVYVAESDETVVGLIAGHLTSRFGCQGELQWMDVAEQYRGQGMALELLRTLAAWFLQHHATKVCVDVAPENSAAQRFYRRNGAVDLKKHWLVWPDIQVVLNPSTAKPV